MLTGVNHITLAVTDLETSLAFYCDVLAGHLRARWDKGAYLELGPLWICLESTDTVSPQTDDTHIAFSSDQFASDCARIAAHAALWKENTSEGASLYFCDPDGHKLELHDGDLASRLRHYARQPDSLVTLYPARDSD